MLNGLNDEQKAKLNTQFKDWIIEARISHSAMYAKWNRYDEYFANEQTPSGFTSDHVAKLQETNDPTKAVLQAKQYVVVNKVRQTHEQVLADFISAKKTITASGRTPKDRKIATITKKEFQHIADRTQLWDAVMVPAIDSMIRRGIHFIKVSHNPYRDLPNGRIEVEGLSCRDVMIDPTARGQYYEDKRFTIHRKRYLKADADLEFKDLLEEGIEFKADRETNDAYRGGDTDTKEEFVTIYEIQYQKKEWRHFLQTNPDDEDSIEEIPEDQFRELSRNKELSQYAFKQLNDVWYVAFYNEGIETFYHEENEFDECTIIELINIRDESIPYPIADSEYYQNLQDLFNILLSVVLENAKQGNAPFIGIDPDVFANYKDYLETLSTKRGPRFVPSTDLKVVYPSQLNEVIISLVSMVDGYIQDMQSKHAASMGEMPAKKVAKETVDLLVTQDRQAHGRKDVTIRYAMTKMAKLITKMMFKKFTETHWAKLTDVGKDEPEYTPVNVIASQQEYDDLLMMMMGVDAELERSKEENIALLQQLEDFRKKFQSENEVKTRKTPVWLISDGTNELRYTDKQLKEAADTLGISVEEFIYLYSAKKVIEVFYIINDISGEPDIDLVYDVDFDYERDRQVRQNQAMYAAGQGWILPKRALNMIEFPDAEAAVEEADKRNEMLQMAEMIAGNPQAMEMVRALFANQNTQEAKQ